MLRVQALCFLDRGPYTLALAPGQAAAVAGPSGSGKSLLLAAIADLIPNTGQVQLGAQRREATPAPEWRRRVCYLAANPAWWAATVREHFASPPRPEALATLALPAELLDRDPHALSTGERQRLGLLRALAVQPQVLLADEPTAALDVAHTAAVERLLTARMKAGLALLLVSHDPDQARRLGATPYQLSPQGLTRMQGPPPPDPLPGGHR